MVDWDGPCRTKTFFLLSNDLMQTKANTSHQQDFAHVFGVSATHSVSQQFTNSSFHEMAHSQEAFLLVAGWGKENNSRETRVASRQYFYCVITVPKLFLKMHGEFTNIVFPLHLSHGFTLFYPFLHKRKSEKEIRRL